MHQFFQNWKIHSKCYYSHIKNCKGCNECEIHGGSYEEEKQCTFCNCWSNVWRIVDDGSIQCCSCQYKEKNCIYRFCANCGNRRSHGSKIGHCTHYDANGLYTLCSSCSNALAKICFDCEQALDETQNISSYKITTKCKNCKYRMNIDRWCHVRCAENNNGKNTAYCQHCGTWNWFQSNNK